MRWSRHPSLEDLISSSGDGLQYIPEISVLTQQGSLLPKQRSELDHVQEEPDLSKPLYFPDNMSSNFLNALIRLECQLTALSNGQLGSLC